MKTNLFINNQDVETEQYTISYDPGHLDQIVGHVAKGDSSHVDHAVQAANKAFLSWRETSLDERITLINKSADRLEQEASSLAEFISKENGMLLHNTKGEISMAVAGMKNLAELAEFFFEPKQYEDDDGLVSVEKKPMGVIAGIVPWNAPLVLTMQKLTPVVLTGNTIVFKPSPFATMAVTSALKMIAEFFPPGVINIVHGDADVGAALTTHPLVRKISFTGGGRTAKQVMKAAADTLKNIHFELGGNDPAIVLGDVDIDKVAEKIVTSALRRTGQYCFAVKRVYVPRPLYNSFYDKVCELVDQYRIGHQLNEDTTIGPMNNRQQYQNVIEMIGRMKNNGANMVELGQKLEPENWDNGYYLKPVVVRDVKVDQEIVTCEQFGPIIPLVSYSTDEEVIQMVNNTEYGLGSSIWSLDFDRALRVARQIEAGMTFINGSGQTPLGYKYIPFGGVKQSGIGRENSQVVLDEYIEYHGINYHKYSLS